eukprot:4467278-Amphidinium_carterae.1
MSTQCTGADVRSLATSPTDIVCEREQAKQAQVFALITTTQSEARSRLRGEADCTLMKSRIGQSRQVLGFNETSLLRRKCMVL